MGRSQSERMITCLVCGNALFDVADALEALEAELERTRQAWVNGDDPMCDDVCIQACKGPCGIEEP